MQTIPLTQTPAQILNVVLDDQYCTISLKWRQMRLYMDLSVADTTIVKSAICQNRADVLQSSSPSFSGTLHFLDLEGDKPPEWGGLYNGKAGRWVLLFLRADEEIPEKLRY